MGLLFIYNLDGAGLLFKWYFPISYALILVLIKPILDIWKHNQKINLPCFLNQRFHLQVLITWSSLSHFGYYNIFMAWIKQTPQI